MYLPPPLAALSANPFVPHSQQEAWRFFIRVLMWTPQLLWDGGALLIFCRILRQHFGGRASQWWLLVPYGMVVGVLAWQMSLRKIPLFVPAVSAKNPRYAEFWDNMAPSVAFLFLLLFLHAVVVARMLVRRRAS